MTPFLTTMRRTLFGAALAGLSFHAAQAADISGAGATFPYPVYAKWAAAYAQKTGTRMNYQSIGSGGGIKQIKAKTVDFGASDMPLTPEELEAAGLVQFPMIMGGVVPVVNLKGVAPGALKLSGAVLADIYRGKITTWDDKAIKADNPDLPLPAARIVAVHRSDGSGTSFLFTTYLSQVSPQWKAEVGANTAVDWPTGIGGKGNEGVASYVKQIPNSIGYVEFAYAAQNKLPTASLRNRDGRFVAPSIAAFQAAAAGADWAGAKDFHVILTDEPGAESWPITGASFILLHRRPAKPDNARAALKFFDWAYAEGDDMAARLAYVPMPDTVAELVRRMWAERVQGADGRALYGAAAQ